MLLQLPKDILRYILSLCLYDTFHDEYARIHIDALTTPSYFHGGCLVGSPMSAAMLRLSKVHPTIRRILISVSVWDSNGVSWCFDEHFFRLLPEK